MKANAEYDLVGSSEFSEAHQELMARFQILEREQIRGMKLMRLPISYVTATATGNITLPPTSSGYGTIGPESGFVWRIGRVTVASSGSDNAGFSTPAPAQPAVPASTVPIQNPNPYPVKVVISGGTLTAVTVNGITVGTGDGTYLVPAAGSISITYSVAPTWVWSYGASGSLQSSGAPLALYTTSDETAQSRNLIDASLQVGQGFYPSSRGVFLMPGEGLLAVVAATVGNIYAMSGQVMSVPAEMMGKLS